MGVALVSLLGIASRTSSAAGSRAHALRVYQVSVTPDGDQTPQWSPNTSGHTAIFTVQNTGDQGDTYEITCYGSSGVTCTALNPSGFLTLAAGQSTQITATYSVGTASGTLTLDAAGGYEDTGYYTVLVTQPPSWAVAVTPDGGSQGALSPSTGNVATFTVQNNGNQGSLTYALTINGCTAPLTGCTSDSASVTLAQGAATNVTAHFAVQSALGTGTITLKATHTPTGATDNGSINVTTAAQPFVLDVSQNFKDRLDKTGCVMGNAGPGAAFYCGELLVMQPLMGYRSMNKQRTPTLVYSSRAATGATEVAADVTLPGVATVPDKVVVNVYLDGLVTDTITYSTTGWSAGTSRRLVVPLPPRGATGVHDGRVSITRWTGQTPVTDTAGLSVVVVKRDSSPFGAGWWIGGVDRAYANPGKTAVAFVDAEGSAVVFRKVGGVWVPPQGETSRLTIDTTCQHGCTYAYKRTLKNQDILRYDLSSGRLTTATDPVGNVATFTWVASVIDSLRLDRITDEVGKQVVFGYDANGRLSSVSSPGSLPTKVYANSSTWNVDSVMDPDTVKTSFGYSSAHLLTNRTGRRTGETSTYTYVTTMTTTGVLASIVTPDGTLNQRAYQVEGLPASGTGTDANRATPGLKSNALVTLRDYRGIATQIAVDRLGCPTRIASPDSGIVTITRHAGTSLPTQVAWTPLGRTVQFNWDTTWADLLSSVEVADNNATTTYAYQPKFHEITRVTTPTGLVFRYGYDTTTRLLLADTLPGNDVVTFAYNSRGQVRSIQQFGHTYPTEYGYDSTGTGAWNLVWVRTPQGHVSTAQDFRDSTVLAYDSSKTVVTQVMSPQLEGAVTYTNYSYDALHRITDVDTRNTGQTLLRQVLVSYPKASDTHDRRVVYTLPSGVANVTRTVTDSFDAMGRVARNCTPAMNSNCNRYSYASGLLTQIAVAESSASVLNYRNWAYDSLGRVQAFWYTAPANPQYTPRAIAADSNRYQYNQLGAITLAQDSVSIVRRGYDAVGRLACEFQLIKRWNTIDTLGFASKFGVKYYYDADGRLTKRVFGQATWQGTGQAQSKCQFVTADTASIRLHYDPHGRVDSLIAWNLKKDSTVGFRVQFDGAGRRDTVRNTRNGWQQTFTYNEDDQLVTDTMQDVRHIANRWQFITDSFVLRDDAGRVVKKRDYDGFWNFTYDGLGQVALESGRSYSYDAYGAGQITAAPGTEGAPATYYAYDNPTGRLTSISRPGTPIPTATQYRAYRYDRAGSRLSDTLWWDIYQQGGQWPRATHTGYDGAGRPASMTLYAAGTSDTIHADSTHWWTYWYDALGRRIVVGDSMRPAAMPQLQRFFYDGVDVLLSGWFTWLGGNTPDSWTFAIHSAYTDAYMDDIGVDAPLYWVATYSHLTTCGDDPGHVNEFFFVTDERGTVRSVAYNSGRLCTDAGYSYTGYGQFASGATLSNSQPGFAGAPQDASGLVYMRNRYYDPNTGTFTQGDPIGLAGGLNLYGYAGNNPIAYTDPFGLCTEKDGWKDCNRMVSHATGVGIAMSAKASGEWTYSQGQRGEPARNYASRVGDCTDYCRNAVVMTMGYVWEGSDKAKANTAAFLNGTAAGFTEVEASAAQPGDIVINAAEGHGGVFTGINRSGEIRALANNGTPSSSKSGYSDRRTRVITFPQGSRFFRALEREP